MIPHVLRRSVARLADDARVLRTLLPALADPYRPLMAHLVVTRRCNLSCGYCHEFDDRSPPVPLATLLERLDHLARLKTVFVTLTGGEALLHPHVADVVRGVRDRGMVPVMNSNGYLLSRDRIVALGEAGLFALQISVDNVEPTDVTVKSLRPLRRKLALLAEHARFRVRINTVLGTGDPEEAIAVVRAALAFGFDAKCSLVRDGRGRVRPVDDATRAAYRQIVRMASRAPAYLSEDFQERLVEDGRVDWKCRAGARYLTICEDGLVHLCESSHGTPGTPLAEYSEGDVRRAFHTRKACAPTCAVAYAHQASRIDRWRPQEEGPLQIDKRSWGAPELVQIRLTRRETA